jgi:hypothetical protein
MSQAEYARHRGVSAVAVHHAVKGGRIKLTDGKVDSDEADRLWAERSRARVKTPLDKARGKAAPPPEPPSYDDDDDAGEVDYFKERAALTREQRLAAEINRRKMVGELIEKAEVRAEFAKQAGAVRDGLLNIPARLAPVLAAETSLAAVQTLLDTEIRAVLAQFVGEA